MGQCMQSLAAAMRSDRTRHAVAAEFYRGLAVAQHPGVVVICRSDPLAAHYDIASGEVAFYDAEGGAFLPL